MSTTLNKVGKNDIELQELSGGLGSSKSDVEDSFDPSNAYQSEDERKLGIRLKSVNNWLYGRKFMHQRVLEWVYLVLVVCVLRITLAKLTVFPKNDVQLIECGDTDILWKGRMDECDIGGKKCLEKFTNHEKIQVRCTAFCRNGGKAWNMIRYADKTVQYKPFLIHSHSNDSDRIYRADSFPCMAGIELGYVSELWGGSIELVLDDSWSKSEEFDADFPASFKVRPLKGGRDLLVVGITVGMILSFGTVFLVFTEALFYFTVFGIVYTTVVLCGDPPVEVRDIDSSYQLLSVWIQRLVPLTGIVWLVRGKYQTITSRLTWVVGLWFTSLDNMTFEQLPIDRLVMEDIKNEKGGVTAVVGVMLLVISCAIYQARILYLEGKLIKYVINYTIGLLAFIWLGNLHSSGLALRIHHWVIGLVLVWGCREVPPSSTLLHGLCLGLIVNGIGKWGFASVLEPVAQISRDHQDISVPEPVLYVDTIKGDYGVQVSENMEAFDKFHSCQLYVDDILFSKDCSGTGIRPDKNRYVRAWACVDSDHCRWSNTVIL